MFCCDHNLMLCSFCVTDHSNCLVKNVDDVSRNIPSSEIDHLYEAIRNLKVQAENIHSCIRADLVNLNENKQVILKETHSVYDKVISKINKMFLDSQSATESRFKIQMLALNHRKKAIEVV